ncbi:MAG: 23S rRNA (uracil(1939)-C(5))-methyltransferase RlmD [Bacillota bacterium]|nr:23S rRNA (uracil(1939)-C(5))-methyltransferase RlmD [Bacillota bacterium]
MNEMIEVTVEDLSHQGEGIAKVNGYPLFIPGALPGDQLQISITQLKKNFGLGRIIRILKASADRVDPLCDKFGQCGGCQTMGLSYDAQLRFKEKRVRDSLLRIGHIKTLVLPVLGMQDPWYYRNKTQLPIGWHHGSLSIGFYQQASHQIVDTNRCYIQHPVMDAVRQIVRDYLNEYQVPIYDEKSGKGLVRHLVVKTGFASKQVMVIVVINGMKLPQQDMLISRLSKEIPGWSVWC